MSVRVIRQRLLFMKKIKFGIDGERKLYYGGKKSGRCNPDEPHGLENGRNRKNIQDFPLEGVSL